MFLIRYLIEENLPKKLTKQETEELFIKIYNGDLETKKYVVEMHLSIVFNLIDTYFRKKSYNEKGELVSVGVIGLINAVNTYQINSNCDFISHAIRYIYNEIINFIKTAEKENNYVSFSYPLDDENGENVVTLADVLLSDMDVESEYIIKESLKDNQIANNHSKNNNELSLKKTKK